MTTIKWKSGKKTGGEKVESPPFIERGENAEVVFEPTKPFFVEAFEKTQDLEELQLWILIHWLCWVK